MSSDRGRVWWLYGPPSVGKSATAWELYAHLLDGEDRGYLDIDQVGMCYPEPADDPGRYALKARAAGAVLRRWTRAGIDVVIISGVLDEASLPLVAAEINEADVTFCRLRVEPQELRRRLESRYDAADVARALTEAQQWEERASEDVVVDTGAGSPLDVARRVLDGVRAPAPAPALKPAPAAAAAAPGAPDLSSFPASSPEPTRVDGEPGRAVLVCGPVAVGKSTAGFGLFLSLLETGRAAAYLDLQQLGFLAGPSRDTTGRHQIVADCVAELWQIYRGVGAQDLVLTGRIEHPDEVQHYRDAVGDTPLAVCRLQTSPAGLRARILARTLGHSPSLAGDTLVGNSTEEQEGVLGRALTEQAHLEQTEVADVVLDAGTDSPEVVVRRLVGLLDRWSGAARSPAVRRT